MPTVSPAEFKRGMVLLLDGVPHVIEEMHSTGTAKFKQKVHARMRHLASGRVIERTFADTEAVPVADLEQRKAQFSYKQGDTFIFLDSESFEPLELSSAQVGEKRWFLKEGEEYKTLFIDGKLVDVVLPDQIVLQVVETGPPQRGSSDSTWKPAKLETGLEIMVPLFIETGERVRVDTAERKYSGKESEKKSARG
ncbi:MAG: elongation factor P [Candidatus Binatia bacterium]|nr:elongation factor P [Candidatus Binatia bacterium]